MLESSRKKDPLGHVFRARGVLLRRVGTDGVPHYFLRFGNDVSHEVVCLSGRYELDLALQSGDVLFVPMSGLAKFGYVLHQISPFSSIVISTTNNNNND